MKRMLKRVEYETWHVKDGLRMAGAHDRLGGDLSKIYGDVTDVWGDVTDLWGNLSYVQGDVTHVRGEMSGVEGALTGVRGDLTGVRGNLSNVHGDLTNVRGNLSFVRGDLTNVRGNLSKVRGDVSNVRGNLSDVWGDVTHVRGNLSDVWGNLSGVCGDLTGVRGNLDSCEISAEDSLKGVRIEDLIVEDLIAEDKIDNCKGEKKGSKFYGFLQNNSGGSLDIDDQFAVLMIFEADSADEANAKAAEVGVYFDGCDVRKDCPCCGDRWSRVTKSDATDAPILDVDQGRRYEWCRTPEGKAYAYVHYKDGTRNAHIKIEGAPYLRLQTQA
jgi:uncharacterized protein YjbJ (UPF0337 family)